MADNNTTAVTDSAPTPPAPTQAIALPGLENDADTDDENSTSDDDADKRLETERKNTRAANRKAADTQRQLDAANKRIKEFEDANKSEDQKRNEALEAAQANERAARDDAKSARRELLRYQGGVEKKHSAALTECLKGATREELEAHADQLVAEIEGRKAPDRRRPLPDKSLGQGRQSQMSTEDQFAAAIRKKI